MTESYRSEQSAPVHSSEHSHTKVGDPAHTPLPEQDIIPGQLCIGGVGG